ncbi:hypothetical protein AB9K35_04155 [Leisingera sp. XS_AS12]|uniref:hypothetical protein n=1 Tax=Leisingera sp. XS_AS12 TaxID=3241294 RepID=UPI003513E3C3
MVDLLKIIENLVAAISPGGGGLTGLLYVLSWITGIVIVMMSIKAASKRSEMGRNAGSWASPAWSFIIGVCFIALPGLTSTIAQTIFAEEAHDAASIFAYAPSTVGLFEADTAGRSMIVGIVTVVQFVGLIGVMRGLMLLRDTAIGGGGGPKTFGPGMTFIIAGVLAVNFPLAVSVIEQLITASAP